MRKKQTPHADRAAGFGMTTPSRRTRSPMKASPPHACHRTQFLACIRILDPLILSLQLSRHMLPCLVLSSFPARQAPPKTGPSPEPTNIRTLIPANLDPNCAATKGFSNSLTIRSYKLASKQTTSTTVRIRTYEKTHMGWPHMLTSCPPEFVPLPSIQYTRGLAAT
jgi:hypothetical protein